MERFSGWERYVLRLAVIAAFALIWLDPLDAMAQGPCDQLVVDDANVFGNRTGDVEAAARDLVTSGADVRVRTIPTYGTSGNLDRYEDMVERQCPSWTDSSGARKNNLVVIMVAVQDRQTGLYYGSQWDQALDGHWTRIQTDIMNPRFAQGDFSGGVIAGLTETNRLIKAPTAGQGQSPASGGASAASIALITILLVIGLMAGLLVFRGYRKSRQRVLAARQKALLAKQGAASKVYNVLEEMQMLEIKVDATASKVAQDDAAPLLENLARAKRLVDQGAQAYSELGRSAGNPENPRLGEAQLGVIAQEYQKVLYTLRQGEDEIRGLATQIASFQEAINGFDNRVAEVNESIDAGANRQEAAQKAGFKTTYPAGILARARQSLDQAVSLAQSKKYLQAAKTLAEADNLAAQAARSFDELPQKKQEAEKEALALGSRIDRVKEEIIRGRDVFERISSTYAGSSWESIVGNGTEAENRVDWALEALDTARAASTMEQQDWQRALEMVNQGNAWMDEAESLMSSIAALEGSLTVARRDAPGEIAAAQADIARAWEYINQYDEDIRESLEDDLREAERKLNTANEELHRDKPDFLSVVKLAKEANQSADRILDQARSEHEAAERMRVKASVAMREARSRVSIAHEYIKDHMADSGDEARNLLSRAEAALHQAETASDLNTRIPLAETAESAAISAYSSARARVEAAWERRSRPGLPPVIMIPGGGGWGAGTSWGSRRSGPFGSGGGGSSGRSGSGGSTRWGAGRSGGGGGRGGGSTGW